MMELDTKVTKNESDLNEERKRATEEVKEKNIAVIRNLDILTKKMSENSGSITRLLCNWFDRGIYSCKITEQSINTQNLNLLAFQI